MVKSRMGMLFALHMYVCVRACVYVCVQIKVPVTVDGQILLFYVCTFYEIKKTKYIKSQKIRWCFKRFSKGMNQKGIVQCIVLMNTENFCCTSANYNKIKLGVIQGQQGQKYAHSLSKNEYNRTTVLLTEIHYTKSRHNCQYVHEQSFYN